MDSIMKYSIIEDSNKHLEKGCIPWYVDRETLLGGILNSSWMRKRFEKAFNTYGMDKTKTILNRSAIINRDSYPSFFDLYQNCCNILEISNQPKVFASPDLMGINAISLQVGNDPVIMCSLQATILLPEPEAKFLLGHELGHHQQGNLLAHSVEYLLDIVHDKSEILGAIIDDSIKAKLKRWSQHAEFNADRAGYLCCKDMNAIESLFSKIQDPRSRTKYRDLTELYQSHPFVKTRLQKIREFAQSVENLKIEQ